MSTAFSYTLVPSGTTWELTVKITAKRDADLHLRMPADLKQALDDLASIESRRTTDYIIMLLIDHVSKKTAKKAARI